MWIDLASVACSLKGLWPCQSRFWQRGMKPCGSAARKRRTMKAPRGIQSSCQPETSCQWSLGVTTLTRDDSPASKRFTPQKVMQNSDICCQKGDTFFLNCNYTEQRVVRFLLKRNLHRYTEQRINEVTLIKIQWSSNATQYLENTAGIKPHIKKFFDKAPNLIYNLCTLLFSQIVLSTGTSSIPSLGI